MKLSLGRLYQFILLSRVDGEVHFPINPLILDVVPGCFCFCAPDWEKYIFKNFAFLKFSNIKLGFICLLAAHTCSVNYSLLLSKFSPLCLSSLIFTPRILGSPSSPSSREGNNIESKGRGSDERKQVLRD